MLSNDTKSKWPYEFGLVYSVTLSREGLGTSLQVRNQGSENFEFQVLLHTYLAIEVRTRHIPRFCRLTSSGSK
jgi:glucose-6-phosphate 1-epimerase